MREISVGRWFVQFMAVEGRRFFHIALLLFLTNQLLEWLILLFVSRDHAALCQWDCHIWYATILEHGYDLAPPFDSASGMANWAFFPLFPMLAAVLQWLSNISNVMALLLVSKLFFFLSIWMFIHFAHRFDARISPWVAGMVLAFNPYSIYGNVGYTESLFLVLTIVFFQLLQSKRYLAAGLAGGLLSSVRVVGVATLLPYLLSAWREWRANSNQRLKLILAGMLLPSGLALFSLYLYYRMGDGLAFMHVQRAWGREMPHNPFVVLWQGLVAKEFVQQLLAWMSLPSLVSIYYLLRTRQWNFAVFSLFCTMIPLSTGLMAMPRYIWWQAPFLYTVALAVSRMQLRLPVYAVFIAGLITVYLVWFIKDAAVV